MSYNGWMLPDAERARILGHFPPRYDAVKASHITLSIDNKVLPTDAKVFIVGYADDGSLEALVCAVDGTVDRPDGGIFHLTLSHALGRASKEANQLVQLGWESLPEAVEVETRAFLCKGGNYITSPLTGNL